MNLGEAKSHVRHAIGGFPSVAPGHTVPQRTVEVINHAGNYLYNRPWKFRESVAQLDTFAASRTMVLPSRYSELVSLTRTVDGEPVELATPEEMDQLLDATSGTAVAGYISRASVAYVAASPQLIVWPTPQATTSKVARLRYRVAWDTVPDPDSDGYWLDTRGLEVPKYGEALFVAYLRAFAQGYEDEGINQRLMAIDQGPIYQTTAMKDGLQSRDVGRLQPQRGGTFRR